MRKGIMRSTNKIIVDVSGFTEGEISVIIEELKKTIKEIYYL